MSVQIGIVNYGDEPVNRTFLTEISKRLITHDHDRETAYFDRSIGMLYRAFHTTAESRLEYQPYVFAKGLVMTWDGRLDNREELTAKMFKGIKNNLTDVAIVAAAFDRWGTECFAKLRGDWSLAVWKPEERELVLARDFIGVRQQFYYVRNQKLLWSNYLEVLALCGDTFTICDEYIAGYLATYPPAHLTPYLQISSVPPGAFVRIRSATVAVSKYWTFHATRQTRLKTDAEYEQEYRQLFEQSVRSRLRADSPILAELSGGLDSSAIVCMADRVLENNARHTPRLDTFSYYDSSEPGTKDDLRCLTVVEQQRGRKGFHTDLKGSGDSLSFEYETFTSVPGFGSRAELKTAVSNIMARREYRVLLSGLGGDEVNGKTLDPCVQMADMLLRLHLVGVTQQIVFWGLLMRRPAIQLLFETLIQFLPVSLRSPLTEQGKVEGWIGRDFARKYRLSARLIQSIGKSKSQFMRPYVRDTADTVVALGQRLTHELPSGFEQRYPYLDQNLVEFLTTIPPDQLLRPGNQRSLMRRALRNLLPPEIVSRRSKGSSSRCYPLALDKHWLTVSGLLLHPLSQRLGYIDRKRFYSELFAMRDGRISPSFVRLLKALSLESWLRHVEGLKVISVPL